MQESIEESLELIDDKYDRISEILEIPLFFDSPEIKRLLNEIKDVRETVLNISNKLSGSFDKSKKERQRLEKEED